MKIAKHWFWILMRLMAAFCLVAGMVVLLFYLLLPDYQPDSKTMARVSVRGTDSGFQLFRGDNPIQIKGVAGEGYLDKLVELGGNTIRLYHHFVADSLLNLADSLELNVLVDIEIPRDFDGFDYLDKRKTDSLLAQVIKTINKYKEHPSVLGWNLGNEVCQPLWGRKHIWQFINRLAKAVKKIDPEHLTSTSVPLHPVSLIQARLYGTGLDFLGINAFKQSLQALPYWPYCFFCWEGPYLYSEIGPQGTWQVEANDWNVHVEWDEMRKSAHLAYMYENWVAQEENCLGTCAFFWGFKQERTHSWYSFFTEKGEKTPMVDELGKIWSGEYYGNRAPWLENILLNGQNANQNVKLIAGSMNQAEAYFEDPEGDSLQIVWEIYQEGNYRNRFSGEGEDRPDLIQGLIVEEDKSSIRFQAPSRPGAYRIFAYARDGHNNCSTFNFPFFVVLDQF